MKLLILVEQLDAANFRATIGQPWGLSSEATTRTLAIEQVKELLDQRLKSSEVIEVDVAEPEPHPWAKVCGVWRDHPDRDEFEANIREYRRQANTPSGTR